MDSTQKNNQNLGARRYKGTINKILNFIDKLKTPMERRQELRHIKSAMENMTELSKQLGFQK